MQHERVVAGRLAGELDRVEPCQQLLERDLRLEPRQRRADAEVDAPTEGDVPARLTMIAVEPELVGVGELRGSRLAAA